MDKQVTVTNFDSIQQMCDWYRCDVQHPLAAAIDLADLTDIRTGRKHFGIYSIVLKDGDCGPLAYGRTQYDYQQGAVVFFSPGQIAGAATPGVVSHYKGLNISFHPDLLIGTALRTEMKNYTFFGYDANEALHVSERERQDFIESFKRIRAELDRPIDKHTKRIVTSEIQVLLDKCQRYYERQFITREVNNNSVITRFDALLSEYFESGLAAKQGQPTVKYCADRLCLSSNYFGDLVKNTTGKTAKEYIQLATLEQAKHLLRTSDITISEIAFRLGFEYPHHLNRLFQKYLGVTPLEFRNAI